MKEVKEAKLSFKHPEEKSLDNELNFIICPVTSLEFNGTIWFVGLFGCGCVFSKKLVEVELKKCPVCDL